MAVDTIHRHENRHLLFRQHLPKKGQGDMQAIRVPFPATMVRQSLSYLQQSLRYRLTRPKSKKETF
ncbi:hypothetical protein [Candidatus Vondammii sp. HM_W22]|uniref:hypothetical protein n=1 Tax=Candidatus Vondammii sp. HM_W22 TaxID=2687299 RepID=UPI002E7AF535|nr:hypothetical protein [Candidatus Vondammii sp. HM_W22]